MSIDKCPKLGHDQPLDVNGECHDCADEYEAAMTNEQQEPTPAEQRVLDAIRECCIGGSHQGRTPHYYWTCPDTLAALREYGAEQRAAGHTHEWVYPTSTNALAWTSCGRCGERYDLRGRR